MFEKFIESLKKNLSQRTVESYIYGLNIWNQYIGAKLPKDVTKGDMVLFREWLEDKKYAGKSANLIIASLRKYHNYLYERDVIQTNHTLILKPFRTISKPKSISTADINKIFDYVLKQDLNLGMFYMLMRFSGLRLSEALRVRGRDVIWKDTYAIINNVTGKGGQMTTAYYVPLISGGRQEHYDKMKSFTYSLKNKSFLPKENYRSIATQTWRISKEIGIKFSCHSFRHTFAYGLLSENVEIPNIASFMRHKSTKVTEEIYLKMDVNLRNKYIAQVIKTTMQGGIKNDNQN